MHRMKFPMKKLCFLALLVAAFAAVSVAQSSDDLPSAPSAVKEQQQRPVPPPAPVPQAQRQPQAPAATTPVPAAKNVEPAKEPDPEPAAAATASAPASDNADNPDITIRKQVDEVNVIFTVT